jgi:diaminohydroxyphosphoribosylaminopyrimidine deaminase/5-amino-6-(5-phosphoribosylamino)uracil reductase
MSFTAFDHACMARALRLAERGLNTTTPNPRVGCVLVKDGQIIGEGWHMRAGTAHAEVHALNMAGGAARGATAYVTLEPCAHHGRTPPCCDALIAAGIDRVVVASSDPNPLVAGQGIARMQAAGIEVSSGLLSKEADELNIGFMSRMRRGRPWVRVKCAASLDGKTALNNGVSQWITGPEARADGHRWRARACAILTGSGTVLADNPRLDVREHPCERQPLKVVVDSQLRTPPNARLLASGTTLIATCSDDSEKIRALEAAGAEVMQLTAPHGKVPLPALLELLGQRGINELHVEAGQGLNGALLADQLVDEWLLYLAPMLIGNHAQGLLAMPELTSLQDAARLQIQDVRSIGNDLRILARPHAPEFLPTAAAATHHS